MLDIFILPPGWRSSSNACATGGPAVIARLLRESVDDMAHWSEFRYVVVNDEPNRALGELLSIVRGEGAPLLDDRPGLAGFARGPLD